VQYSEEEYKELRENLIRHMRETKEYGEYFPMSLCAFAYNETFAPDLFPMTREEVLGKGWNWYEEEESKKNYMGADVDLPEDIAATDDAVTKQILLCKETGKAYKIIPQELQFYRSMNVPAPALCPDERHRQRVAKRNPYKLWQRKCDKCHRDIETTNAPERVNIVYCQDCYLSTVY
jgi:hypothetical protein